jgi:hypothetical protein
MPDAARAWPAYMTPSNPGSNAGLIDVVTLSGGASRVRNGPAPLGTNLEAA